MTVVLGLGTRLRVCMRTTFENGVLRNGQQLGSAVNSSIDQGEFRAMETLSVCIALRCDKDQLYGKIYGEYLNHFRDIVVEHCGLKKERRMRKMALLLPHLHFAVFHVAFGHLYESC